MARGDSHTFDPANLSGFNQFYFEIVNRFRDEAIDAHIDSGNLSDLTAHVPGIVAPGQLLNHFEPPLVFSVLGTYDGEPRTTLKEQGELNIDVAVFNWDYSRVDPHNLDYTVNLTNIVIDNVEDKRTLTDSTDQHPLANDVAFGPLEPDYEFSQENNAILQWVSVQFTIDALRIQPT